MQVLNREVEKTTLLKVQVEKAEKRQEILKRWFQEDLAQKQEERDATRRTPQCPVDQAIT